MFNFQENITVLVSRLNELKWQDFFLDFMKWPSLNLISEEYAIKVSILKLCLRDDLETEIFELGLLIIHAFLSQLFNVTDNLEATRATHSLLDLAKSYVFRYLIF